MGETVPTNLMLFHLLGRLSSQQLTSGHSQNIGGFSKVAQIDVIVIEVLKDFMFSSPYFHGGRLATTSFSHLPHKFIA
jgi:hypothetical protein